MSNKIGLPSESPNTQLHEMSARPTREFQRLFSGDFLARLKRKIRLHSKRASLTRAIPNATKRLVVFLSPGHEFRAGGVMAIALMCQESLTLRELHGAQVVMCSVPGEPPLLKYGWFENSQYMLNLDSVLKRCDKLDYLLLNIPDYQVNHVSDWLNSASQTLLRNIKEVHLNIMIFNIDMMKGQEVSRLKRFGKVTCTTAHEAYSNAATRDALDIPLHKLKICTGAEFYSPLDYAEKEPIMIVSSDVHPLRQKVLDKIKQALPDLKVQAIHDLTYGEYKSLIRRAKWALTFGEGLDGYFAEPTFSGSIAFAVFNPRFFTPPFAELENVYPSWTSLIDRITADLQRLDEPATYNRCWRQAYDLLSDHFNTERFRENLRMFYRGEYTFP